jgi:hypothetical protein
MALYDKETDQKALPYVANNFRSFTGKVEAIRLYEFWPTRFVMEEKLL